MLSRPTGMVGRLLAASVLACALLAAIVVVITTAADMRHAASQRTARLLGALEASQLLERHVVEMESGLRGFVPTGDRVFLAPYYAARAVIPEDFARLSRLTSGEPAQVALVPALHRAVDAYTTSYALPLVNRRGAMSGAKLDAVMRRGKALFDALRARFERLDAVDLALQSTAARRAALAQREFELVEVGATVGLLVALFWLVAYVARVVVAPVQRAIAACAAVARREPGVKLRITGARELRDLASAFNGMVAQLEKGEKELREAEERFRQAFEEAPNGTALVSPDGRWLRVNEALCEMVGYPEHELLGQPFTQITHPDDLGEDLDLMRELVAGVRDRCQFEKRYLHKDGRPVWVRLSVSLVRAYDGQPIHFVSQIEDVTDRKEAERQLAQARAEISRFFGLSLEMMCIANAEGYFVRVNPAFERTLGWSREELLTRPFLEFVHPEDVPATVDSFVRQAQGENALSVENRYRCKDGSYRWLLWSATALEDGFVYAIARDMTDRREIEEQLRTSHEQALAASRLKSEFVANMSHEIRTPLNGVVSMSELLLETELSGEQREYAQVAVTSAHALMRVIDDILDFSKIEAGKLHILEEDYAIEAAVAEVCEIVGAKAREKRLELAYEIEPSVPPVLHGDPGRVRQVLMNLVGNAVKFTHSGEVVVHVGSVGGVRLRVTVTDTGVGVDSGRLASLFEPFAQADATTTRRYGGTGLGLSIAKQLVELMGGSIGATSKPGHGSTFWFELPLQAGDVPREPRPTLAGHRVLIVDDNHTNRAILERRTSGWGMTPTAVESGPLALQALREASAAGQPFGVALLDHQMPDMDGIALAREIRRDPRLRATRVLILSSATVAPTPAEEPAIDGVLVKPLRESRLYDEVVRVLGASWATPEAEAPSPAPAPAPRRMPASQTLLVVEDNEINQFAAVRMFEKLGYRVELARNGREATELAAGSRYAAIFMDCQMPELDGYEATAQILALERGDRRTPIIAMTASTMEGDRERCLAAGMDDYLPKPLRLEPVQELCRRLIPSAGALGPDSASGGLAPNAASSREPDAPSEGELGLFDPAALEAMAGPAEIAQLLCLFIEQLEAGRSQLQTSLEGRDLESAGRTAHRLAGSAATLGAHELATIARMLAAQAAAGSEQGVTELGERLQAAAAATVGAMQSYAGAGGADPA